MKIKKYQNPSQTLPEYGGIGSPAPADPKKLEDWAMEAYWTGLGTEEYNRRRLIADNYKQPVNPPADNTYEGGNLDELVVTANSKTGQYKTLTIDHNNWTSEYNEAREYEEYREAYKKKHGYYPGKIIHYNPIKAQKYERSAQKAANLAAIPLLAAMAAPAIEIVGAPLIKDVVYPVAKGAYNGAINLLQKATPYFNLMSPGTKEFMTMWNSGIGGKAAGTAILGTEAYYVNDAVSKAVENPNVENITMATLSAMPYINGAINTAKTYKPVRDFISVVGGFDNAINNISKQIKKAPTKLNKWWNTDKRIKHIADKALDLENYYDIKYKDLNKEIDNLAGLRYTSTLDYDKARNKFFSTRDYDKWVVDQYINTSAYDDLMRFNRPKREKFYLNEKYSPFGASRVSRSGGSGIPEGKINLEKLSVENVERLLLFNKLRSNSFNLGLKYERPSLKPEDFNNELNKWKKDFTISKDQNGNYIVTSNVPSNQIVGSHPYDPEQFVNTQYSLGSFQDPSKPLISGEIKFGNTDNVIKPFVNLQTGQVTKAVIPEFSSANKLVYLDPAYRQLFAENMAFVEKKLPGFVPYGSSVGLVDVGLPHSAGDIDGYMKVADWENFLKNNPGIKFTDHGDLKKVVFNEQMGENGIVDINLVHSDKNGYVSGERGILLARMFFPDVYALWNLHDRKGPLKVKIDDVMKAASELRAAKTVADSFEINPLDPNKRKHLGRPFVYLSSGDPLHVAKGLELYGKSFGVTSGFPTTLDELMDVQKNKQILKDLNMPVSFEEVATDPQKMKNVLDYWYANQTVRGRGVNKLNPQLIINALTQQWDPLKNTGGTAGGAGRNSVVFGNSGHGPVYGFLQIQPKTPLTGSIEDKINQVKRFTGMWDYEFTPEEVSQIQQIGNRFGLDFNANQLKNSETLLNSIPSDNKGASFMNTLSNEMGIQALTRSSDYGSSGTKYSSILEDSSQAPIMIYNGSDDLDRKLIRLLNLFGRNKELKPGLPINLEPIYKELQNISSSIKYKNFGEIRRRELDTPLYVDVPWKKYVEIKLKKVGQFENYQKQVKDAENAYLENKAKLDNIDNLLELMYKQRKTLYDLNSNAYGRYSTMYTDYYDAINKAQLRKKVIKTMPLILSGAAAAGSGIGYLVNRIAEGNDVSKYSDEKLLVTYRSAKKRFEKSRLNEDRLRLLEQELKNRGIKY